MTDDEKLYLDREFSKIAGRVWTSKILKSNDEVPDLFHYTNATGLLGIVRSRSLWATHFQSMNDPSEMRYGMNLAHGLINALVDQGPKKKVQFLRGAAKCLGNAFARGATPYVVSFSDDGRLPKQWKEYGDGGAGFSIAFDLARSSNLFGEGTSVLKITYDAAVQGDILSSTIEEFWNVFQEWELRCGQHEFALPSAPHEYSLESHCQSQLVSLLLTECVAFKNPSPYRGEQEWRLARFSPGGSPLRFRSGPRGIVPYIELMPPSGQKLPIKRSEEHTSELQS